MDYLTQANKIVAGEKIYDNIIDAKDKKIVVMGGGDTGADCVGVAHRQGAKCVMQIELLSQPPECRTTDMPWPKYPMILKISTSHQEGGMRHWSVLTKKFIGENGKLKKILCVQVDFSQKDNSGCPVMKEIPDTYFEIDTDLVILCMGFIHPEHNGLIKELSLELDSKGNIKTDTNYSTSIKSIFCAGDMHRGQSLIVWAIYEGRQSAYYTDQYLRGCLKTK